MITEHVDHKACCGCLATKPLTEFYRQPRAADGHYSKCKSCVKQRVRQHRLANLDRVREYDRGRGRLPEHQDRVRSHQALLKLDPDKVERHRKQKGRWARANTEKRAAHFAIGNAIRDGLLVPQPCERCGSTNKIHAHHEDYSKPFDVTWLCPPCHGQRHREINDARRDGAHPEGVAA